MTAWILAAFLFACTSGLVALTRRSFERMLPLTFFCTVLVLYLFGVFGALPYGVWALLGLAVASLLLALYRGLRRQVSLLSLLCTPGCLVFYVLFFFFWYSNNGYRIMEWDDFTHWALVVKNMFYFNDLGLSSAATTLFKEYPPATSLLQYFVLKLHGGYHEGAMNGIYIAYYFALLLPMFDRVTWKRKSSIPLMALVCVLLPLAYSSEAYRAFYADPLLGLQFAFILFTFFADEKRGHSGVTWISIGLACAVMTLTKGSGIGLACIALLILFCIVLARRPARVNALTATVEEDARTGKRGPPLLGIVACLCAAVLARLSWGWVQSGIDYIPHTNAGQLTWAGLVDVVRMRAPDYRYNVISNFFNELTLPHYGNGLFAYSHIQALTFFALIGGAWVLLRRRASNSLAPHREAHRMVWLLLLGSLCYTLSLLIVYLFTFSPAEATALAGMSRYMGTYFLGMLAFYVTIALHDCAARPRAEALFRASALCAAALMLTVNLTMLIGHTILFPFRNNVVQADTRSYDELEQKIRRHLSTGDPTDDRVYFLAQHNKSGYLYLRTQYALTPVASNGHNDPWSFGTPLDEHDAQYTQPMSASQWVQRWIDGGYTMVYLHETDEAFPTEYGALFEDPGSIAAGGLYRIAYFEDRAALQRLE